MSVVLRAFAVAVVAGGTLAGIIDIGAACLINGQSIPFILHAIAGGLLAERSFAGGTPTAVLGVALQELMGVLIAAVFVGATRVLPALRRHWIRAGVAYGVIIFLVMNYVVVPLSAWHTMPHFSPAQFVSNLAAMLLFGLIVAYFARRQPMATPLTQGSASVADPNAQVGDGFGVTNCARCPPRPAQSASHVNH